MKNNPSASAREIFIPFMVLLSFWMLLVPEISPESVLIGSIISAGTVYFCRDILFRSSEFPVYSIRTIPVYTALAVHLLGEIVKSNIYVAVTVLSPRMNIQPQFIRLPVSYKTEFSRFAHSQCITLTPGTISVYVESGYILVHALTDNAAEGLKDSFAMGALKKAERIHLK